MAGPSGAGMVQAYLRMSRAARVSSGRREYLTALRRESNKHGGADEERPDLVAFDCMHYCMSCGHLSEPRVGDPMRREAQAGPRRCEMCGATGLVDLRETGMVEALSQLEVSDQNPSRGAKVAKLLGVFGLAAAFAGVIALLGQDLFSGSMAETVSAGFLALPVAVVGCAVVARALGNVFGPSSGRRSLPRRWRMPQTAKRPAALAQARVHGEVEPMTELLRAPLSGRPCIAYEVAVRDDADPASSFSSWRLVEQDNVGFRVGDVDVAAGEALLQRRRELVASGVLGSLDAGQRRFMRERGLLDSEDVHVYETILEPGAAVAVRRRDANAPVLVS